MKEITHPHGDVTRFIAEQGLQQHAKADEKFVTKAEHQKALDRIAILEENIWTVMEVFKDLIAKGGEIV